MSHGTDETRGDAPAKAGRAQSAASTFHSALVTCQSLASKPRLAVMFLALARAARRDDSTSVRQTFSSPAVSRSPLDQGPLRVRQEMGIAH